MCAREATFREGIRMRLLRQRLGPAEVLHHPFFRVIAGLNPECVRSRLHPLMFDLLLELLLRGIRVWGLEFGVWSLGFGAVWGLGLFGVWVCLRFRVWGLGFGAWGLVYRVDRGLL